MRHLPGCAPRPAPVGGVRIDFFNINEIAARRLFDEAPLLAVDGRPPRVMVAGTSGFGLAAVVAAARSWRVCRAGADRLPLTLVGAGAVAAIRELGQRYPFLDEVCELSAFDLELLPLLSAGLVTRPPDRLLACHRSEEHALKSAMAAERSWRGSLSSVVVRLDSLAAVLGDRPGAGGASLLDAASGVLRPFGVAAAASDPALIRDDLIERLAQVIHDRYRQSRRARGDWPAEGDPSLAPWDDLTPQLRSANRTQAADIGRKLAEVSCTISPRFSREGDAVLTESDLEFLARLEHERWRTEHELAGWTFGAQRSEGTKQHPGLLPWGSLPAQFRRRSRDAVQELSDILSDAGFRIVRG